MSIGVPIKVLHEAEGHIVTCETNTGEVYRGKLIEAEDNMNCQMSNITVTYRDGRVAQLEQVYIRGSKIRFLILPDMLKNAPMLKSMKNKNQGAGAGRGKAAILKAQVAARGRGRGGVGRGNIFQKRRRGRRVGVWRERESGRPASRCSLRGGSAGRIGPSEGLRCLSERRSLHLPCLGSPICGGTRRGRQVELSGCQRAAEAVVPSPSEESGHLRSRWRCG
ncbi:small nuclear ribonucleoprotein Sm D3 [Arapaima gigas]